MEFLTNIFYTILYQPLLNTLVLLYAYLPGRDFGVAVIALTLLVRLVFYPATAKGIVVQRKMAELQPKLKKIQEELKNDKEKQIKATMALYKQEKISPFAPIIPLLIQLPILITLYQVFLKGAHGGNESLLYSFVPHVGSINPSFFGLFSLDAEWLPIAIIAGLLQFVQAKQISKFSKPTGSKGKGDFAAVFQQQMLVYIFPIITVVIVAKLPAALGLYWATTSIFTILQQWYMEKKWKKQKEAVPQ